MIVVSFIFLGLGLGLLFQFIYVLYVKKKQRPIGFFTHVGKSTVHSIVSGDGEELVVFLGGNAIGSTWADMYELQKNVSAHAKTVVYERPGYGWSPLTNEKRTITLLVGELHNYLLTNFHDFMKMKKIVIVAHSISGLEALFYAKSYPQFVKGIVFIDAASPTFCTHNRPSVPFNFYLLRFLRQVGILNLLLHIPVFFRLFDERTNTPYFVKNVNRRMLASHYLNKNALKERQLMKENGQQVLSVDLNIPLEDIRVMICTSEKNPIPNWKKGQLELKAFFKDVEVINFPTNNHMLHHEYPKEISELISLLLTPASEEVRL
ncbi:alpha/beta fold hydrolase [Lysinibacillus fusiformis]|uniref:alpha/beta fold hydrolase n=1 Tax=Lysinibacillus fusiformis TaxID=28031 RepID=UPI003816FAE1